MLYNDRKKLVDSNKSYITSISGQPIKSQSPKLLQSNDKKKFEVPRKSHENLVQSQNNVASLVAS